MVAADFTLYTNPVNKALHRPLGGKSSNTSAQGKSDNRKTSTASSKASHASPDDEMIASDMTKYDSPLAELEKNAMDKKSLNDMSQAPQASASLDVDMEDRLRRASLKQANKGVAAEAASSHVCKASGPGQAGKAGKGGNQKAALPVTQGYKTSAGVRASPTNIK